MIKHFYLYVTAIIMILLVSSCSSTKNLKKNVIVGNLTQDEYVMNLFEKSKEWNAVSGKIVLTINKADKEPLSVSGSLKIKRNEVIQLSIAPILGIEVARAEFTPNGILIIDRLKKRYITATFDELRQMSNTNLDYNILQSLFLNSVFVPGKQNLTASNLNDFSVTPENDKVIMSIDNTKTFNYTFIASLQPELLKESEISLKSSNYKLLWKYDNFKDFNKGTFPTYMNINVIGGKSLLSAEIEISRLSTDVNWEKHTEIPQKYKKVELQEILKQLLK